jgi:DNA-binding transcriptional LysR family regulator
MRQPLIAPDLLRTVLAVHQTGTLAKAAQRVGRTQSAVSLQMRRLQEQIGVDLFVRRGRALVLTEAGHALVGYAARLLELNAEAVAAVRGRAIAGRVSFGMSADFEPTWLPRAMARFAKTHPRIEVALRVDRNGVLEEAVDRREVDIALFFCGKPDDARSVLGTMPMAWIGAPELAWEGPSELGLLLLEPPCVFRAATIRALDRARIGWRVAVTSPSLGALWATAAAGMGVTVRSAAVVPAGLQDVGERLGLPPLPDMAIRLREAGGRASAPRVTLRNVLRETVEELLATLPVRRAGSGLHG